MSRGNRIWLFKGRQMPTGFDDGQVNIPVLILVHCFRRRSCRIRFADRIMVVTAIFCKSDPQSKFRSILPAGMR